MRLSKRRREHLAQMDMTPMIDIVFLLLIFFMTVSQVSEVDRVRLELPQLAGAEDQKPGVLTVNVDAAGELILGGRPASLSDVITAVSLELQRLNDDPSRLTVVIRSDRRSESRPVNEVVSALSQLEVRKVRIAVQEEG